jgi:hypothetical protein
VALGGALTIPGGTRIDGRGAVVLTSLSGAISGVFSSVPAGMTTRVSGNAVRLMPASATCIVFH